MSICYQDIENGEWVSFGERFPGSYILEFETPPSPDGSWFVYKRGGFMAGPDWEAHSANSREMSFTGEILTTQQIADASKLWRVKRVQIEQLRLNPRCQRAGQKVTGDVTTMKFTPKHRKSKVFTEDAVPTATYEKAINGLHEVLAQENPLDMYKAAHDALEALGEL